MVYSPTTIAWSRMREKPFVLVALAWKKCAFDPHEPSCQAVNEPEEQDDEWCLSETIQQ